MKNLIAPFLILISFVACDTHEHKKEDTDWHVHEEDTVEFRDDIQIEWKSMSDSISRDHEVYERLEDPYTLAAEFVIKNANHAYSKPLWEGFSHWFYGDKDETCEMNKSLHYKIKSKQIWLEISDFLATDKTGIYIECPVYGTSSYLHNDDTIITCGISELNIKYLFKKGSDASSDEFDVHEKIKKRFFKAYEYREEDWIYVDNAPSDSLSRVAWNEEKHVHITVMNYAGETHQVKMSTPMLAVTRKNILRPEEERSAWIRYIRGENGLVKMEMRQIEETERAVSLPPPSDVIASDAILRMRERDCK